MPAWVTPVAQVANFLVLVWLLRRFLYGPIVRIMDERQQKVTSALRDAETREQAAEERDAQLDRDRAQFEASREQLLADAREQAQAEAQHIHEDARAEADAARERWQESLRREQADVLNAVRLGLASEVGKIASAALRDLADADLLQSVMATFARKLDQLPDADAAALAEEARREGSLTVRSALVTDDATRRHLRDALRARLGELPRLHWVADESLGFGLRVETNGRELGWSATDYLDGVSERLHTTLEQRTATPQ
jgi:F-type H+-transporting ATPase subunit b